MAETHYCQVSITFMCSLALKALLEMQREPSLIRTITDLYKFQTPRKEGPSHEPLDEDSNLKGPKESKRKALQLGLGLVGSKSFHLSIQKQITEHCLGTRQWAMCEGGEKMDLAGVCCTVSD